MENKFHGFDHLKADQNLKDKTKEQILLGAPIKVVRSSVPMIRAAIAACLAVVIVGGSTTIFFLSNDFSRNKAELNNTANKPTEDIFTDGDSDDTKPSDGATNGTAFKKDDTGLSATTEGDKNTGSAGKPTTGGADSIVGDSFNAPAKPGMGDRPYSETSPTAGTLTAKMWNDNLNFSDWLNLLGQDTAFRQYQQNWNINLTKRITVTIKSDNDNLASAVVTLLDQKGQTIWSAVSDNTGKAYLFYNVFKTDSKPTFIIAKYKGKTLKTNISNLKTDSYAIVFSEEKQPDTALDLMFVCDTTGSMGDELRYLQAELEDIILQVKKQNGNIPLQLSVNFYRDKYDSYVVRPFPFTTEINSALQNLKQQSASGGGDFEEAVDQALNDAIHNHQWSNTATAKLLFLVLDAPPHDTDKAKIQKLLADAAERGIRVIPVTASGIDKNTEYLMRAFSVGTGGTYVALTNDSGVGGDHIAPSVGETQVYKLNDLIVKIINSYLQ